MKQISTLTSQFEAAPITVPPVAPEFSIVPFERVGKLRPGMSLRDIQAVYGSENVRGIGSAADPRTGIYAGGRLIMETALGDAAGWVATVVVVDERFMVDGVGVKVGTTLAQLQKAYGELLKVLTGAAVVERDRLAFFLGRTSQAPGDVRVARISISLLEDL